jgi:hypothetical protein
MKPVLSALCVLALIPVATLASDNPQAENSAQSQCLAQAAEARLARLRSDSNARDFALSASLRRDSHDLYSSSFPQDTLSKVRTDNMRTDPQIRLSACYKFSGTQLVAKPRGGVTWKTGPR